MKVIEEDVYIIVSKDRKAIAKGVPRDRYLSYINDKDDKGRILTYTSKSKAESAFNNFYFYTYNLKTKDYDEPESLEAVKAKLIIEI